MLSIPLRHAAFILIRGNYVFITYLCGLEVAGVHTLCAKTEVTLELFRQV